MTKTKITDPEAIIALIQKRPSAELHALQDFLAGCEKRQADPDPATSIRAEIEGERASARIEDFQRWPIESRARQLADEWVVENVVELVALLRSNLTDHTKSKDGFMKSIGTKVSAISLEMFAPTRDRDQLAAEREKMEEQAAELEAAIFEADQAIRMLGVSPSLASFRKADAAVNRINLPAA
jgi:hypothetical protein